jgi:hypothetical protein
MFLEVSETDLEAGKAYLVGTWPTNHPAGSVVDRKDIYRFFGPVNNKSLAMDSNKVIDELPEGWRAIAKLMMEDGVFYWKVFATTDKNTPAYQDFERISIFVEESPF